ncbi:O-methyltransferase [Actinomadura sp. WMMA1423]|uniref:O-methyltransferase n=1 Tax=Actinomadura sp. WMMA1423 TaxID=2591108 RepID=UPI0011479281|nr:class I SAM-dependent methyltransferase [Actinomadura sp. WMMA1423]
MANQLTGTGELLAYIRDVSLRDDPLLRELRDCTAELPAGGALQVMAEEGQFLGLLVGLAGASRVLELGTFTGYSTLCMARALAPGGRLLTCDISDRWTSIAAPFWERAGVADRIEQRIGQAAALLAELAAEPGGPGSFDVVFIDADKVNYAAYYEASLTLARAGGLIVFDNTLFFGRVLDPAARDADTEAIRKLNKQLFQDERVDISLLPFADGITLARKR